MAKRKAKKKGSRGRKRSRGLSGAVNMSGTLAIVAGAVAAGYLNKVIPATVNDKIVAGGKVALGIALPHFMKSEIGKGLGAGFIAVGSVDLLKSFGALSGDFDIPTLNGDHLSDDDLNVINGLEVLNGEEEELNGTEDDYINGEEED